MLKQSVVIAPGELFSLQGLHSQYVRLSHGFSGQHDLDTAMAMLADALRLELTD
ncbi:hypothetical protein D3C76_1852410 [compost metagenome]